MTSAVLNTTAKGAFSSRPNLPFRMLSNVRHPPKILDKARSQGEDVSVWTATLQNTIDRTAGTTQKTPRTPDEIWAERSRAVTFRAPADSYTGLFPSTEDGACI